MGTMDDLSRLEAKGLARAKIRSKRRRVQLIRRRTIRGSLALFALAWAIVFGQLVTGNDPALSRAKITRKLLASTQHAAPRPEAEGAAAVPANPAPEAPQGGPRTTEAPGESAAGESGSGEEAQPGGAGTPAPSPTPPLVTSAS